MKRINKNFVRRPRNLSKGWIPYDKAISAIELEKKWPAKPSTIYRSDIVKSELDSLYHKKCGFCNQKPVGSPLQVEHFRPKDGVKNELHSGYYWLGYEWTNLLFACGNCNRQKSTSFPLEKGSSRITTPILIGKKIDLMHNTCYSTTLKNEKPTLINPEIDNPDLHLIYLPDGEIYHLSERGRVSIQKYDLNRDELYLEGRKKILDLLIRKLSTRLSRYSNKSRNLNDTSKDIIDVVVEDILSPIEKKDSFDHFRSKIYTDYSKYILPRFGRIDQKSLLNIIFRNINSGIKV
ncbi:hypothetical protein [Reichenbachiella sp.]|uniref:hypothetical protein n=1 Tax=Reichenbachiella sp. TaxID=2184521 RepID=UPI00329880E2